MPRKHISHTHMCLPLVSYWKQISVEVLLHLQSELVVLTHKPMENSAEENTSFISHTYDCNLQIYSVGTDVYTCNVTCTAQPIIIGHLQN